MKKTLKLMGLCALAVLALAGCKKNEQTGSVTLKATLPSTSCESKTEIGTGNYLWWSSGDQIVMYGYTDNATSEATARTFTVAASGVGQTTANFTGNTELPEADYYKALYPAANVELNGENRPVIHMDSVQSFVNGNFATNTYPMFTTSVDGQTLEFFSPCGILAIPMKGTANVGRIVLKDKYLQGLVGDIIPLSELDTTNHEFHATAKTVTLDCGEGVQLNETTATNFYFVVAPSAFMGGFTIDVFDTEDHNLLTKSTTNNCMIFPMTIRVMGEVTGVAPYVAPTAPVGALPNGFSVSPTQRVWFSRGNLQASTTDYGATWTWSFATNQYDYIGGHDMYPTSTGGVGEYTCNNYINGNGTVSVNGTVDLFGWSTAATYYGIHNSTAMNLYYGLSESFVDWGNNTIVNGTNPINPWRTLSITEWHYLFNLRTDATSKWGQGNVNGVNGLIILPDLWTLPDGLTFTSGSSTANVYTLEQWTQMENNGAAFLPSAEYREGTNVYLMSSGLYWSCTAGSTTNPNSDSCRGIGFNFEPSFYFTAGNGGWYWRYRGMSVRLVQDINE